MIIYFDPFWKFYYIFYWKNIIIIKYLSKIIVKALLNNKALTEAFLVEYITNFFISK